jgi:hypothetical protein
MVGRRPGPWPFDTCLLIAPFSCRLIRIQTLLYSPPVTRTARTQTRHRCGLLAYERTYVVVFFFVIGFSVTPSPITSSDTTICHSPLAQQHDYGVDERVCNDDETNNHATNLCPRSRARFLSVVHVSPQRSVR